MQTGLSSQAGRGATGQSGADAGTEATTFGSVLRAAALTAAAVVVADLFIYFAAAALWGVPGDFAPLFNPVTIVVVSAGAVVVAAAGLAVLARFTRRAVPIFVAAAIVVTLLSLAGPLQAMAGAIPGLPLATAATVITMIVLHFVTGGLIAGLLPAQARR